MYNILLPSVLFCLITSYCYAAEIHWEQIQSYRALKPKQNEIITAPIKININFADKKSLMKLEGIGAKKANAIIAYRKQQGLFQTLQDLEKVKGITKKALSSILEKNKDSIVVSEDSS